MIRVKKRIIFIVFNLRLIKRIKLYLQANTLQFSTVRTNYKNYFIKHVVLKRFLCAAPQTTLKYP